MKKDYTPILPFDATQTDNFVIYDTMKYVCKVDQYQTERPIKLHHNSMVKYYTCNYEEKPMKIGGD